MTLWERYALKAQRDIAEWTQTHSAGLEYVTDAKQRRERFKHKLTDDIRPNNKLLA